jgi:hypothetical protein
MEFLPTISPMRCAILPFALLPLFFAGAETPVQKAAQQPPATLPPWAVVLEWDPVWQASAGAQYRSLGGLDWHTGSYLPRAAASLIAPLVDLPQSSAGSGSGFASRTYRDGYVRPDSSTPVDGLTEVWGYTDNDQFQNGALLFHGTVYDSAYAQSQQSGDWNDDARGASAFVALDWLAVKKATKWGVFRAGMQGSVSLLPLDYDMTTSTLSAVLREESIAITDRYELGGLVPPLAPFAGTVGGGGPLIDAAPDGRSEGAHALLRERQFSNVIHQELDVLMTSISFGPTLEWQGHEDWALQGSLGLALNVVRWEATQTETLNNENSGQALASWEDAADGTEVMPGFYLQLAAQRRLTSRLWFQVMGRYDWIGTLHERVGPSSFSLDLNGWTVGAGFVWRW